MAMSSLLLLLLAVAAAAGAALSPGIFAGCVLWNDRGAVSLAVTTWDAATGANYTAPWLPGVQYGSVVLAPEPRVLAVIEAAASGPLRAVTAAFYTYAAGAAPVLSREHPSCTVPATDARQYVAVMLGATRAVMNTSHIVAFAPRSCAIDTVAPLPTPQPRRMGPDALGLTQGFGDSVVYLSGPALVVASYDANVRLFTFDTHLVPVVAQGSVPWLSRDGRTGDLYITTAGPASEGLWRVTRNVSTGPLRWAPVPRWRGASIPGFFSAVRAGASGGGVLLCRAEYTGDGRHALCSAMGSGAAVLVGPPLNQSSAYAVSPLLLDATTLDAAHSH